MSLCYLREVHLFAECRSSHSIEERIRRHSSQVECILIVRFETVNFLP
jgi:hypothetical protein